jgi:hypothetical protein
MWKQWNKTDRRIMSFALAMLLLMSYLLYDDSLLFPAEDYKGLNTIGKVLESHRDVRRKVSSRFLWRAGKKNDSVHAGDSIFTGEKSTAVVQLADGRLINLQENSLVVFSFTGDQLNLDLKYGKFTGKIDGCVKVKVAGELVEVCGTDSKVEIDAKGSIGVVGNAKVKRNGQAEADPNILPEQIRWKVAPPNPFYHFNHGEQMAFSWESKARIARYRVQYSKESKFENPLIDEIAVGEEFVTVSYPAKGKYFVRVLGEDLKQRPVAVSRTESILIIEADKPAISMPLADEKILIKTDADGVAAEPISTTIQWNYSKPAVAFQVQMSNDKDFAKFASANVGVGKFEWNTPAVQPGIYFVRVRELSTTKSVHPWSTVVRFQFELAPPAALDAPILLTKKISYDAPQENLPLVLWKPVDVAQKYLVEFSESKNFAKKESFWSDSTKLAHQKYLPGKSFFRVFASSLQNKLSAPSEIGELNVDVKKPIIDAISDQTIKGKTPDDPGQPIEFSVQWTDLKVPDQYQVQISASTDFSESESLPITSNKASIKVPKPGTYFFRVQGMKNGKAATEFSDPVSAKYILNNPLAPPILAEPVDQMTLFFQKDISPFVWLEWKPVKNATHYNVELAQDPDFAKIVYSFKTNTQRYLIKDKLPQGLLYWRAQALGADNSVSPWATPFSMTVFTGKATDSRQPANKRR